MDSSLPRSSVHGVLQARILEWVAMPFSKEWVEEHIKQHKKEILECGTI